MTTLMPEICVHCGEHIIPVRYSTSPDPPGLKWPRLDTPHR